ncbi:unnamed protein product [Colias eurytheme]|nr:unnamed protein product [Colias eurytheme]
MAFLGKVYTLDRNENLEEYIKALKLPEDKAQSFLNRKDSQKLDKVGDEYVLTLIYSSGPVEIKFKSGVEFDEQIRPTITARSTFTVEGNTVTHVQKFADGNIITYVREFTPEQFVMTITTNFWSGSCKQIYVAQ